MSQRISLVDLERKKSGSRAVYFIFFGSFLVITLFTIFHFYIQPIPQAATPTPTLSLLPGVFSPNQKYRALRVNNQLQIFEGNSDNLLFKLFDDNRQYQPDKWAQDSQSLVYRSNSLGLSNFGLIYLSSQNIFIANPEAVSHNNCGLYGWSPDNQKLVFYNHIDDSPCVGTLIEFNSQFSVRELGVGTTKNGQTYQSLENAFWDSDSKKLNINLSIGKYNNGLDKISPRSETKIIAL